jgi:hypothetical protein
MNATIQSSTFVKPTIGQIAKAGAIAAALAAAGNAIVWLIASLIGSMMIPLPITLFVTVLGIAIGGLIYFVLSRITRRANTIFIIVSVLFLIAYAFGPIGAMTNPPMPGMPVFNMATVIAAEVMHIVAGVIAIVFYTRAGRQQPL